MKLGGLGMNTSDELREIADTFASVSQRIEAAMSCLDVPSFVQFMLLTFEGEAKQRADTLRSMADELDKATPGEGEV